jgi:hypothetical protein
VSVVAPVPPFATPSVPAIVIVPETVTGPPEKLRPVVPPETSTLCTVPPAEGVAEIKMPPAELVIVTFVPAVRVAKEKPDPLPIGSWPLDGVAVRPVPP